MTVKSAWPRLTRVALAVLAIGFIGFAACVPRGYYSNKGIYAEPTRCPKGMAAKGGECFCMPGYKRMPIGGQCPAPDTPPQPASPHAE